MTKFMSMSDRISLGVCNFELFFRKPETKFGSYELDLQAVPPHYLSGNGLRLALFKFLTGFDGTGLFPDKLPLIIVPSYVVGRTAAVESSYTCAWVARLDSQSDRIYFFLMRDHAPDGQIVFDGEGEYSWRVCGLSKNWPKNYEEIQWRASWRQKEG